MEDEGHDGAGHGPAVRAGHFQSDAGGLAPEAQAQHQDDGVHGDGTTTNKRRHMDMERPAAGSTMLLGDPRVITQALFMQAVCSPAATTRRPCQLFDLRDRPPPRNLRTTSSVMTSLTEDQDDLMYALAGCSDVHYSIKNVSTAVADALRDVCGISASVLKTWFKNRATSKFAKRTARALPEGIDEGEGGGGGGARPARGYRQRRARVATDGGHNGHGAGPTAAHACEGGPTWPETGFGTGGAGGGGGGAETGWGGGGEGGGTLSG
ncbi:hypothetical protein FOA52_007226 [Chlamydomonas sp. UWO 241]|nr:hypothetical protein FOA52_007226 [Chlamydomonas sp. UWO 241]